MVTNGLTLAIIAGVPLGVLVGEGFGWRATFLGAAGLAALSLLGIVARLPRQPPPGATASLGERLLVLAKRGDMLAVLATSVLTVAGTFTVYYRYLGVFLADVAGLGSQALALVVLGFGLANAAYSGHRDRSVRPIMITCSADRDHSSERSDAPRLSVLAGLLASGSTRPGGWRGSDPPHHRGV